MNSNERVVEARSKVPADTCTLYLTTHNYDWNVTGPMFNTLHTLFETHEKNAWMLRSHLE